MTKRSSVASGQGFMIILSKVVEDLGMNSTEGERLT